MTSYHIEANPILGAYKYGMGWIVDAESVLSAVEKLEADNELNRRDIKSIKSMQEVPDWRNEVLA